MSISILGLGTAVPQHTMSQTEAVGLAHALCDVDDRQRRLLNVLYRKSGVKNRNTCLPHHIAMDWAAGSNGNGSGQDRTDASEPTRGPTTFERMQFYEDHAFPLVRDAARNALDEADIRPNQISHLVTVSCTGFYAPGVDVQLIRHFGLPATTERVQVGFMGCHGALNGLRVVEGLAAVDPNARILLCAVELCCIHYRFQWDPERFLGNALFADGAGVLVAGRVGDEHSGSWRLLGTGSCLIPDSLEAMSWRIGDHGFEMTLAATVPDLIDKHLRPWLSEWLAEHGKSIDEIGCWAVHPGGPRILTAVRESLGLPDEALAVSREVLSEHGNMSSPTVLFILQRFRERGDQGPCVMLGFGPGLVAEAALWV